MEWSINQYGIKTGCIHIPGLDLAGTYVTANGWIDERHMIVSAHKNLNTMECSLLLVDIEAGKTECVTKAAKWPCFCVKDGVLYYLYQNRIYRTDLKMKTAELIFENAGEAPFEGPPGITSDGKYISLQHQDQTGSTAIDLFLVEEKRLKTVYRASFCPPFSKATHSMVNPSNPKEVFFCHEGDCHYITNRMWIYSGEQNAVRNFYKQSLDKDGANGDCCGHEMWAENGMDMFFVKYPASTIEPKGIFKINIGSGQTKQIAGQYPYWHVGVYRNGEILAGDTMGENGDIHVVLICGGQEKIIADAKTTWQHPVHPHPVFSPSGRRLYFTTVDGDRSVVRVCEIERTPKNE